jgi:hypothetical protein
LQGVPLRSALQLWLATHAVQACEATEQLCKQVFTSALVGV